MKNSFKYLCVLFFAATVFSCTRDNYAPPNSFLSGQLVYQGQPIGVERNAVHFQIYQFGFGKVGPVSSDETFAEDGSYSAVLFDGNYKVIIPNGEGPFMWKQTAAGNPDSVSVTLKGDQKVDLEVTPYYTITSPAISAVGTDSVSASFGVQKIITDSIHAKDIEYVALYINKTQFVASSNSIASAQISGSAIINPANIQLGVLVPAMVPKQGYVFARIGLKIVNVEALMFSPLVQVPL